MIYLIHLPPPLNGSSVIGKIIKESCINSKNTFIDVKISITGKSIGKIKFYKLKRVIKMFYKIYYTLKKDKTSLVYFAFSISGTAIIKDMIIAYFLILNKRKIIFHFHNKRNNLNPILNFFLDFIFKNQYAVILSKSLQKWYPFPFEKTYFLENPVISTNQNNIKTYNYKEKLRVLVCSNLYKFKGILDLFEIIQFLNQKIKCEYEIIVLGEDGDLNKHYLNQKSLELGLHSVLKFKGGVYGLNKVDYFQNSHIFLHPTYDDCLPLVIAEALKYNLPVISTNIGGIKDMVDDRFSGFLHQPGDCMSIANSLFDLMDDEKKRLRQINYIKRNYKDRFDLNSFKTNFKSIINDIKKDF